MTQAHVPSEIIKFNIGFPGIPVESALSAVGLVIQTFGILHTLPINLDDPNSLTTGNPQVDTPILAKFLELKNLCHHINVTFNTCLCKSQMYDNVLFLTFECS
ncbi:hypothetical protein [Aeromonas phage AerS_266]|nr:hypothetical protein [Aeromonas phage AerS_266]